MTNMLPSGLILDFLTACGHGNGVPLAVFSPSEHWGSPGIRNCTLTLTDAFHEVRGWLIHCHADSGHGVRSCHIVQHAEHLTR